MNAYLWIFLLVCVDIDFLLHNICLCGIYYIIKNIQENVSRNETKFRGSCTDTFQVCFVWSLILWLEIMLSAWSICPILCQYVFWLVNMSSDRSIFPPFGNKVLYSVNMSSDPSICTLMVLCPLCALFGQYFLWLLNMSSV